MSLTKKKKQKVGQTRGFFVFNIFYVFSLFACGSARLLNSSPGILLRVQNRKIVPDIIPAGQKSVLIPGHIWPHIILRAQKSVLIPGHI